MRLLLTAYYCTALNIGWAFCGDRVRPLIQKHETRKPCPAPEHNFFWFAHGGHVIALARA